MSRKYCWPSEEDLNTLEKTIISSGRSELHQRLFDYVDGKWSVVLTAKELVFRDLTINKFKCTRKDTSSHCRKINSIMQTYQPLWKQMKKLHTLEHKSVEIDTFCSNNDRVSDNEARTDFALLAEVCSLKTSQTGKLNLSQYAPLHQARNFREKLRYEQEFISTRKDRVKDKIFVLLDGLAAKQAGQGDAWGPFPPGPVGDSPVHDCFLLGLHDLGRQIIHFGFEGVQLGVERFELGVVLGGPVSLGRQGVVFSGGSLATRGLGRSQSAQFLEGHETDSPMAPGREAVTS